MHFSWLAPKACPNQALSSWNCVPRHQTKQSVATMSTRPRLLASRGKNEKWLIPKSFPVSRSHYDVYRTAFGNLLIWFAVQRNWLFHERCKKYCLWKCGCRFLPDSGKNPKFTNRPTRLTHAISLTQWSGCLSSCCGSLIISLIAK